MLLKIFLRKKYTCAAFINDILVYTNKEIQIFKFYKNIVMKLTFKSLALGLAFLSMTSCEEVLEDSTLSDVTVTEEVNLLYGFSSVAENSVNTVFEAVGCLVEFNRLVSNPSPAGPQFSNERFGLDLAFGEELSLSDDSGTLEIGADGNLAYFITMSDASMPFVPDLSIVLGTPYVADLFYSDVSSLAEFEEQEANNSFKGVGDQSIEVTFTDISNDTFWGTFSGFYISSESGEAVEISGEFKVNR